MPPSIRCFSVLGFCLAGASLGANVDAAALKTPVARTSAEILASAPASAWRPVDPERTLYLDFSGHRVIIELAPEFAPRHVANIKVLVRENYFDGLAFLRSQDNYVVQWGDPNASEGEAAKSAGTAARTLPAEFDRALKDLSFTTLPDGDVYAPQVGYSNGLPTARDPKKGRAWLAHCYGMVGAGRDLAADSGGGTELYVVIGHAPRHLDRNVTLVGRVLQGMEYLSVLPRGSGALGFYEKAEQRVPIEKIRLAADLPAAERIPLEILRTDTATFSGYVAARRFRREEWFLDPVGHVELCNVPIPVRIVADRETKSAPQTAAKNELSH